MHFLAHLGNVNKQMKKCPYAHMETTHIKKGLPYSQMFEATPGLP